MGVAINILLWEEYIREVTSLLRSWSAALLLVTGVLLAIGVSATAARKRGVRIFAGLLAGIVSLESPLLFHALLLYLSNNRGKLPPIVAWCPLMFSILVMLLAMALFPQSVRWRAGFVGFALLDAGLNLINTCAPGWCGRYGFPFPYFWWSDAIVVFNGNNLSSGTSTLSLIADVFVLIAIGVVMSRFARRTPAGLPAPQ